MTYARKRDYNHSEIRAAFEGIGFSVVDLSRVGGGCPDLLVSIHKVSVLVEIKNEDGRNRIDPSQVKFHRESKAWIEVCRDIDDVIRIAKQMKQAALMYR